MDSSEPPAETEGGVEAVDSWSGSPEPPAGTETEPDGSRTFVEQKHGSSVELSGETVFKSSEKEFTVSVINVPGSESAWREQFLKSIKSDFHKQSDIF